MGMLVLKSLVGEGKPWNLVHDIVNVVVLQYLNLNLEAQYIGSKASLVVVTITII